MSTETVINRPAKFVETLGENLATAVTAQQGIPLVAQTVAGLGAAPTQRPGEDPAQFKIRQDLFAKRQDAAQMFQDRQTSLGLLAPKVAGQDQLQRDAQTIAQAQAGATGIAGFQPFLTRAQQEATLAGGLGTTALGQLGTAATTLGGIPTGAMTTAQTQQFMSPYQSQVIDASLAEFDRNTQIQQQGIRDQQAALGALGSGRAGVQLAEFGTGAARERALLQAGLLQQGFQQAQAARQQDIQNRFGLGQAQAGIAGATQGLGQFRSGLAGQQAALGAQTGQIAAANVGRLGSLGALNQAQTQAGFDAQREAARMAAFQPQEQLDRFAGQVAGIMGGYPGSTTTSNVPNPTPLQSALGLAATGIGAYLGSR